MGQISKRNRRRQATLKLSPPRAIEVAYARALRGALRELHKGVEDWLIPNLGEITSRTDGVTPLSGDWDAFVAVILPTLRQRMGPALTRMVLATLKANAKGLRLIGIDPRDQRLGAIIDRARDENIRLVENAGRAYAASVRKVFEDPAAPTRRVEDLKADLLARGDVSESRAELIARDQVLKLNGAITKARQENAGIVEYEWSTSLDERVRESHRALEGKIFRWDNPPPETGHPGEDFQCRCVAIPVLTGDQG